MWFGPVTPEFTLLTITSFEQYGKKRHITPNISEYHGPILTYFTGLVGALVRMIILIFVSQSPKGRCYGNQLHLGAVCRRLQERPLLFVLAFDNGSDDHESDVKWLNGNNLATWYINLVNLCLIISEFTMLKRRIFAATWLEFDNHLHALPWLSETDWKIAILISEY